MKRTLIVLLTCALALGCVGNGAQFFEKTTITEPDGTVTVTETNYRQASGATWGAEQGEASGSMAYGWENGRGKLSVGNASVGQTADDPAIPWLDALIAVSPIFAEIQASREETRRLKIENPPPE